MKNDVGISVVELSIQFFIPRFDLELLQINTKQPKFFSATHSLCSETKQREKQTAAAGVYATSEQPLVWCNKKTVEQYSQRVSKPP